MKQRGFCFAFFSLHLFLVFAVSSRDVFSAIAAGETFLPRSVEAISRRATRFAAALVGQHWPRPARALLRGYLHSTGIEAGYSYFAPNVSDHYRLVFEMEDAQGRIASEILGAEGYEGNLRVASLLDELGLMQSDALRELILKMLATAIWQRHPEAIKIRAVLGVLDLPSAAEFKAGKRETYRWLETYEFTSADSPPEKHEESR